MKCPNCRREATAAHFTLNPDCMVRAKSMCGMLSQMARKTVTHAGGRPRSADRCACGIMTQARAAKRNHVCGVPSC